MQLNIPTIRPVVWIAATLIFGLTIAGVYLGGRIVSARPVQEIPPPQPPHISAPVVLQPTGVQQTNVEPAVSPQAASAPPPVVPLTEDQLLIQPHHGQQYIQVGAVNVEIAKQFIQHLRDEKLDPHIAPGPAPDIKRLLIGPFDNHDALNSTKAQLESEGIATFVRQY